MDKSKLLRLAPAVACFLFFALPVPNAEAGLFDRIKGIYNAPDIVDELREQYEETARTLEEQRRKLTEAEDAMRGFEEEQSRLRGENELYRQQNEALKTQNEMLAERLELLEKEKADKQAMYRKWIVAVLSVVALIAGYVLSIRIWRYGVWRNRRRLGGGL